MADSAEKKVDPVWAWEPYRPSAGAPWDVRRAGHLHRRAAFGATAAELDEAVKDGPEKTIQKLLDGGPDQAEYDQISEQMARSIAETNNGVQLRAWWLHRMLYSPAPVAGKDDAVLAQPLRHQQRQGAERPLHARPVRVAAPHALGNFSDLLQEMSKDPAMLVWLDGRDSKKGNPNENYGRELMELFSLGIGNYTEKDVREAARAFTGWEIQGAAGRLQRSPARRRRQNRPRPDGQRGTATTSCASAWNRSPRPDSSSASSTASSSAKTVPPTPELIEPLAEQFRKSGYDFGALVKTVLSSNLFFSETAYRKRIKSPVDFALGIVRGLEGRIGTTALVPVLEQLGQNVFNPPSVKGWDGGPSLAERPDAAVPPEPCSGADVDRRPAVRRAAPTPRCCSGKHGKKSDDELLDFLLTLFLQGDVRPSRASGCATTNNKPTSRRSRSTGRKTRPPTTASAPCVIWC